MTASVNRLKVFNHFVHTPVLELCTKEESDVVKNMKNLAKEKYHF